MEDIFNMFGMGGRGGPGGQQQRGPSKPKPKGIKKECSLEDLYNGKEVQVEFERLIRQKNKEGEEEAEEDDCVCPQCKGRGMKMVVRQLGPGMITQ